MTPISNRKTARTAIGRKRARISSDSDDEEETPTKVKKEKTVEKVDADEENEEDAISLPPRPWLSRNTKTEDKRAALSAYIRDEVMGDSDSEDDATGAGGEFHPEI